jgi:hypothetical protein
MMGKAPSGSFPERVYASVMMLQHCLARRDVPALLTRMADTSVIYFYPDFMCLGRSDLDIFH